MAGTSSTLVELLLSYPGTQAPRLTILEQGQVTHTMGLDDLAAKARALLGALQGRGIPRGAELVLQLPEIELFLTVFWAGVLGGMVPVPITPAANKGYLNKLVRVLQRLQNPYVITSRPALDRLRAVAGEMMGPVLAGAGDRLVLVDDLDLDAAIGDPWRPHPADVAFVQFSSGSTGDPKGVVLTHDNILTSLRAMTRAIRSSSDDSALSWLPLTHDMGLIGMHLGPVYQRANHALMDPRDFVRRPLLWLDALSATHASVTVSPDFGLRLVLEALDRHGPGDWDLSRVRVLFDGAEPLSAHVCRRFLAALGPFGLSDRVLVPGYGMSEATLGVTFGPVGSPLHAVAFHRSKLNPGDTVHVVEPVAPSAVELVDLGTAVEDCAVRVVDLEGNPVDDGVVGRVEIQGRNVSHQRYGETRERITEHAWLSTGDLGFVHQGHLFLTGREKEVICINGRNYYPPDLEALLEGVSGLEPGHYGVAGVFSWKRMVDQVILFVDKGEEADLGPLLERARARLFETMTVDLDAVARVRRLPRTTSGKLQRYRLARRFEQGKVDAVVEAHKTSPAKADLSRQGETDPDHEKTVKTLLEVWDRVADGRPLPAQTSFLEGGVDSLLLTRLQAELDQIWPGRVGVADLFVHNSLERLAAFIDSGFDRKGRVGVIAYTRLPGVNPDETGQSGPRASTGFRWEIFAAEHRNLAAMGAQAGGYLEDTIVAVVAAVLRAMGALGDVALQVWSGKTGRVSAFNLPVEAQETFSTLLEDVVATRRDPDLVMSIPLEQVVPTLYQVPRDMVSVLIYRDGPDVPTDALKDRYDVRIGYRAVGEGLAFLMDYTPSRVRADTAESLAERLSGALSDVAEG